ncbi:phage scaffolding protein [Paenibacillus riograndensis]|uniref:Minor structural GP20 protein n=1 Tax=Paenibacillus riograndensis SBR5 TaxID=1073571 RepID=A0A0E4H9W1_9BACL|nr:phage scaffolding protein [Paenibacillus riograndensis]CQR51473.1 minor structural GP20 protein [Paenibacillus riograndensis SBR5]
MEWLKELLKKAGVEESKVDGLIGDVNKELPKHFVPKSQYNELTDTKKKLEKDITDRDTQLEALSKDAGASETLKAEIARLQGENKTTKEKYEADLKDMTLNNAITAALNGKVHNEKVVTGLIDKNKLVIGDDGKVVGLDEQLTTLKTSDAYLFKPDEPGAGGGPGGFRVGGGGNGSGAGQATNEQLASIFGVADSKQF